MAAHKLPGGSTWYDNGTAGWETDPSKWDVAPNADGGLSAAKKNWAYDYGVPLAIGSIFGYGAFGPGGYASLAGGGGAGGAAGTQTGVDLAAAPAFGSTEAGVIGGVDLGAGGVSALPLAGSAAADTIAKKAGSGFMNKLDPTTLMLSALSLLGGPQSRKSFQGAGIADPRTALQHQLQSLYSLQDDIKNDPAPTLHALPTAAEPINVPGLSFQIGGGLGTNGVPPVKLRTPNG